MTLFATSNNQANAYMAEHVLNVALEQGMTECCFCAGNRNSPFFKPLLEHPEIQTYFWPEERSAAFFAVGRSKALGRPVGVIVTSGTAAAELLPAAMLAHYSGVPLLLITADRPRNFRYKGAPQSAEQVGLYTYYTTYAEDIAAGEQSNLKAWDKKGPAHINVCMDEPFPSQLTPSGLSAYPGAHTDINTFLNVTERPFVIVSTLPESARPAVIQFLKHLEAPVFLEGISGIREEPSLQHLRVFRTDQIWKASHSAGFPIDGILRIGGVPTFKLWRDIEEKKDQIALFSISEQPFSAISWGEVVCQPIGEFFQKFNSSRSYARLADRWLENEQKFKNHLAFLCAEEPSAESSIICDLSKLIKEKSLVFLGNSLPVREWDLAACHTPKQLDMQATRGINGIDGQISTFFGLCHQENENWLIIGDLTALYDMVAPWILTQMPDYKINIVIINNSGGQIFQRFINHPNFMNTHFTSFEGLATLWDLEYHQWKQVPEELPKYTRPRLIEILPDMSATESFNKKLGAL